MINMFRSLSFLRDGYLAIDSRKGEDIIECARPLRMTQQPAMDVGRRSTVLEHWCCMHATQ